jgi:hypothetical protein
VTAMTTTSRGERWQGSSTLELAVQRHRLAARLGVPHCDQMEKQSLSSFGEFPQDWRRSLRTREVQPGSCTHGTRDRL